MPQPFFIMVAGPNGSGKTTLTDELRRREIDLGAYFNADEIAVRLTSGSDDERALAAQAEALAKVEASLAAALSFTFETVMSHVTKIDMLRRARASGFDTRLFFVSTEDPAINISRVRTRVELGGHAVPERKIIDRYDRTMRQLREAVRNTDSGALFDNTSPVAVEGEITQPLQMVASFRNGTAGIEWTSYVKTLPYWVIKYASD